MWNTLLFEHSCVLAVCVHNHPIMIKIHPVFFFLSTKIITPFSNQTILNFLSVCRHADQGRSHGCWLTRPYYLRPALSEPISAIVSPPEQIKTRMSPKRLRYFVVGFNDEHIYSRHLSCWRRSGLHLVFEGNVAPIYLNASMFARIISDPASPTEEVSISFFYESLQISFSNNVLVSKFRG